MLTLDDRAWIEFHGELPAEQQGLIQGAVEAAVTALGVPAEPVLWSSLTAAVTCYWYKVNQSGQEK